jgi:nucleoside 2-deoxyribosyltransferase
MSRGRQKISFEGLLQENVLGTFKIIRGFADLRDLCAVSTAMKYQSQADGTVSGYQREFDEQHIEDIKQFLKQGRYRFFPEVILSLRSSGPSDPVVSYTKRRASIADRAYRISVSIKALTDENFNRIHRIDGNHRLEAARRLAEEELRTATFKNFATAPFCFVVLHSDEPEDDELAEAMLFNLINSKALLISSEHSLSVLMRDDGAESVRFAEDPQMYLTRWIKEKVKDWPGFYSGLGRNPLSRLASAAGVLLRPGGISKTSRGKLEAEATKVFGPLYKLALQLRDQHEKFVTSYAFLPIAAEVYARHSLVPAAKGANTEEARITRSARWLCDFAKWFERIGGTDLPAPADPSNLWTVFKREFDRRAGPVFIAMSFRKSVKLEGVYLAITEAIQKFNAAHPNGPLDPIRVDKQYGASFEIPSRVFQEIDGSRLVIADLTDEKPNVYCEVGYAKARGIPFILTSQKQATGRGANKSRVHFDLAPYRRIEYETTHDLRDKLETEIQGWHTKTRSIT